MANFIQGSVELQHLAESRIRPPGRSGRSRLFLDEAGRLSLKRFDGRVEVVTGGASGNPNSMADVAVFRALTEVASRAGDGVLNSLTDRLTHNQQALDDLSSQLHEALQAIQTLQDAPAVEDLASRLQALDGRVEAVSEGVTDSDTAHRAAMDEQTERMRDIQSALDNLRQRVIIAIDAVDAVYNKETVDPDAFRSLQDSVLSLANEVQGRDFVRDVIVRSVKIGTTGRLVSEKVEDVVYLDIEFPMSTRGGGGGRRGNGVTSISALQDVNLSALQNGQVLVWDAAEEEWTNQDLPDPIPPLGGDLDGTLDDATVVGIQGVPVSTSPTAGSRLVFNQAENQLQWYTTRVYSDLAGAVADQANQIIGERIIVSAVPKTSECGTYFVNALTGDPSDYTKKSDITDTASEVNIEDAGGYYPGIDEVEGALQFIGSQLPASLTTLTENIDEGAPALIAIEALGDTFTRVEWAVTAYRAGEMSAYTVSATHVAGDIYFTVSGLGPDLAGDYSVQVGGGNLELLLTTSGPNWNTLVTRTVVHRA